VVPLPSEGEYVSFCRLKVVVDDGCCGGSCLLLGGGRRGEEKKMGPSIDRLMGLVAINTVIGAFTWCPVMNAYLLLRVCFR